MPEIIVVEGLTNQEFFERYAAPGRVGLIGGPELINRLIMRAQRHLNEEHEWSRWSHAFLLQGRRHDGHHWVVESDLDIKRKHIRLGVQENRAAKYFDDTKNTSVAILDFGLTPVQQQLVLAGALELVAEGVRYSLREIAGTMWAMRHAGWCPKENRLAQEQAFYCSSFVRHVFAQAGVDLAGGVADKNTAPEHIVRTVLPHTKWILTRGETPASRLRGIVKRVRAKLKSARRKPALNLPKPQQDSLFSTRPGSPGRSAENFPKKVLDSRAPVSTLGVASGKDWLATAGSANRV